LRIGIDYTAAIFQSAGIGRYTRCLVDALVAMDRDNEYRLLAVGASPQAIGQERRPNVRMVRIPLSERWASILWHRLRLPLWVDLWLGPVDLFHSPDFLLPPLRSGHSIVTVHDLSFIRVPECAHPGLRRYLEDAVPRSVRRADLVLADSRNTKSDLIELLNVPVDKVRVVYAGVEPRFHPLGSDVLEGARARYGLPEHFILTVGTLQPRKNYVRLMDAFALLCRATSCPHRLMIVGGEGWMYERIYQRAEQPDITNRVIFKGFVEDEALPVLYNLADLFVFPSLYEGFGLPPLEAMACGTPVIASDVSSLPEVVGEAALLVDPLDVEAIAEAMRAGLFDQGLRDKMIGKGLERARQFTWARAAQSLLHIYEEVGSAH